MTEVAIAGIAAITILGIFYIFYLVTRDHRIERFQLLNMKAEVEVPNPLAGVVSSPEKSNSKEPTHNDVELLDTEADSELLDLLTRNQDV